MVEAEGMRGQGVLEEALQVSPRRGLALAELAQGPSPVWPELVSEAPWAAWQTPVLELPGAMPSEPIAAGLAGAGVGAGVPGAGAGLWGVEGFWASGAEGAGVWAWS